MNGMIFAAGLGTRLRPLTNDRPKALVELKGKTLLERVIERMREVQVERLVINIHHFADQVEHFLKEKTKNGQTSIRNLLKLQKKKDLPPSQPCSVTLRKWKLNTRLVTERF